MAPPDTRMGPVYPDDKKALAALMVTRFEIHGPYGLRILVGAAELAFSALMAASTSLQRLLPTATVEPRIEENVQLLQVNFRGGEYDSGVTDEVLAVLVELLQPTYLGHASATLVFLSNPHSGTEHTIGVMLRLDVNGILNPTDAKALMNDSGVREALNSLQNAMAAHLKVEPGTITTENKTGHLPMLVESRFVA